MTTLNSTTTNQQWTRMIKLKKQVTWDNWKQVYFQWLNSCQGKWDKQREIKRRETKIWLHHCIPTSPRSYITASLHDRVPTSSRPYITASLHPHVPTSPRSLHHRVPTSPRPYITASIHDCHCITVPLHYYQTSLCHCIANSTANISLQPCTSVLLYYSQNCTFHCITCITTSLSDLWISHCITVWIHLRHANTFTFMEFGRNP